MQAFLEYLSGSLRLADVRLFLCPMSLAGFWSESPPLARALTKPRRLFEATWIVAAYNYSVLEAEVTHWAFLPVFAGSPSLKQSQSILNIVTRYDQ